MATIRLSDAAKWDSREPHQLAAWNWLQEQLSEQVLQEFGTLYRAAPDPKTPLPPPWLAPSLKLIREYEGCRLTAYPDPGTGGAPWTIGWGATRTKDGPVRRDQTITQQEADELLVHDVEQLFGPGVLSLIPAAAKWRPNQIAALTSFAFNTGLGSLEESTIRKRLLAGEDPCTVVREELPRWVHAGEAVLPGLERRRKAEIELFCGPSLQQAGFGNPLKVPYYSQRDSAMPGQANRMCFSSSCAMLVATLRPEALSGANADDTYLRRVLQYGDTTDANAQLKALQSYGIKARFRQDCDWSDLEKQINRGVPVPCGFLHHGPASKPTGGGHWLIVIGYTPGMGAVIVNDPFGEAQLVSGEYHGTRGAGLAYSRKNWGPRWMVEGPKTGWAIIAEP